MAVYRRGTDVSHRRDAGLPFFPNRSRNLCSIVDVGLGRHLRCKNHLFRLRHTPGSIGSTGTNDREPQLTTRTAQASLKASRDRAPRQNEGSGNCDRGKRRRRLAINSSLGRPCLARTTAGKTTNSDSYYVINLTVRWERMDSTRQYELSRAFSHTAGRTTPMELSQRSFTPHERHSRARILSLIRDFSRRDP